MVNNKLKLVKSATAFVIGAAVLTGSFAAAGSDTAFAKSSTSVKVSNGKLVYKSTGKVVKGYKTYNKALYKDGKKLTGLYKKTYYKAGKKATGTYKSVYYKAGKAFTGVTNKTYYKAGKKATGTYKNVYYKSGKAYTGVVNKTYYKAGKKATGLYKGVYYKTGKAATGIFEGQLYVSGNLNKGLTVYKDELYKDGSLNKGLALYKDQLYKDAALNKGLEKFEDKFYFDAAIANGTYLDSNNVERAIENGIEVGVKVKAVEAINGATLTVTFNKSIDSKELFANATAKKNGKLNTGIFTFGGTDLGDVVSNNQLYFAELAEDNRSITFTVNHNSAPVFATKTEVNKVFRLTDEAIKTTAGDWVPKFEKLVSVVDAVAPEFVKVTNKDAATALVKFSEPIANFGTTTITLADGTVKTVNLTATDDATEFELPLSALTAGKTGSVKIVGVTDFGGNVTNPNPVTFSVTKGQADEVAPTVETVTQTGAKEFTVKFSEQLQTSIDTLKTTITVSNQSAGVVTVDKVEQDKTDKTKYVVTVSGVLDKASTVTFAANKLVDLSGEVQTNTLTKVVNFTADIVAPKVASYVVVKDAQTGKEYLDITFDKNVNLAQTAGVSSAKIQLAANSSYVKNYVTTVLSAGTATVIDYKDADDSKKVVRVALDDLLGASDVENAVYTAKLVFDGITSESAVAITTGSASFARTSDSIVSTNQKLSVVSATAGVDNDKVNVVFDKAIDGATAIDPANYTVQGATVESVTLHAFNSGAGTQTVTLNLKANSNVNSGNLNVTIANVKNADKTRTVETTTKVANLKENVAPTVTKAELTGLNKIKLTFSEPVYFDESAFALFLGINEVQTETVTEVAKGSEVSSVELTISEGSELTASDLISLEKLVVKPVIDKNVQDANDNYLDLVSIEVPKSN